MKASDVTFYSTVAQLLPVLVIFAAIELRLLKPVRGGTVLFRRIRFWAILVFCPLVLLAEQACLLALVNDHVSTVFSKTIIFEIAMVCLGIVVLAPPIYHLNEVRIDGNEDGN